MFRSSILLAIFLAGFLTADIAPAADPTDREQLRVELAELKAVATELSKRIEELEQRLVEPLKINDIVVVEINRTSTELRADGSIRTLPTKPRIVNKMHAAIEGVLPNGDYILRGHRSTSNNGTQFTETLTGVASRKSIDRQRHVSSDAISDLKIERFELRAN